MDEILNMISEYTAEEDYWGMVVWVVCDAPDCDWYFEYIEEEGSPERNFGDFTRAYVAHYVEAHW